MARLGQKLQILMRQDGYVTAQEVADAVGLSLSAAHSRIEAGTWPGRQFDGHWFVNIRKLAAEADSGPTVVARLKQLAMLVGPNAGALAAAAKKAAVKRTAKAG